jgi:CRISPR-associated protein Cas1
MRRLTQVATPIAHLVGPGSLAVTNGQLVYRQRGQESLRLQPESLRQVYCYGAVGVSEEAFVVLCHHGIEVAFLTPAGTRCKGRLVQSESSRTGLRRLQHRVFADEERVRQWAEVIVVAKIDSQLAAARHYQRHGLPNAGPSIDGLEAIRKRCRGAMLESLRGYEGTATATWFGLLGQVLKEPWQFRERVRRPPTDPINALLSLAYTLVLNRTVARCEAAGLEVNLGALHDYRPGRPSLACDLMEPLRVPAVDRWVVMLCNQRGITPEDFVQEGAGFRLHPDSFGRILWEWEKHWQKAKQEAELDGWVERLESWLRQGDQTVSESSAEGSRGRPDEDL